MKKIFVFLFCLLSVFFIFEVFDNDKIYTFSIVLTDKLGGQSVTFTTSLAEGRPIMFVDSAQTGVGVNCFPSFSGLEVNGPILSNRYAWVGQTSNTAGSNTYFKFDTYSR